MFDGMCCPLEGNEHAEGPSCSYITTRRARKDHRCTECRQPIAKGVTYEYASGIWDGRPDSFKTCLPCAEIRNHFACGGWIYGQLWSDLHENFFPDMTAGGPCMTGLSPAAKQWLIDSRMKWYFDQGEIDDSAWEHWPKNRDVQRPLRVLPDGDLLEDYYSRPEVYWPERLKREALMWEYEAARKLEDPDDDR